MRELFDFDFKNYAPDAVPVIRPSVRAIVIRDGRVWMVGCPAELYGVFHKGLPGL